MIYYILLSYLFTGFGYQLCALGEIPQEEPWNLKDCAIGMFLWPVLAIIMQLED